MPYSEINPDNPNEVLVFDDSGAYIGTESFAQNQGLEGGGIAERTNNYTQPDPQQQAPPPDSGGTTGATEGTTGYSSSRQYPNGGLVYATSAGWYGSRGDIPTRVFATQAEAEAYVLNQQSTYGGNAAGLPGNPPPDLSAGIGPQPTTGSKTVAQMRAELLSHGDPRWATASDAEVIAEYTRLSTGAVTPPRGTLGTQPGTVTTAPIDLLRVQNELAYQLYLQDKLNRLEIPEFHAMDARARAEISANAALQQMTALGYYVDPVQFRNYLFGDGQRPGADTTMPTLQRQAFEAEPTGYYQD